MNLVLQNVEPVDSEALARKKIEEHYSIHFKRLVKKYAFLTGSLEGGEDVVQESYYRALKYASAYNHVSDFGSWFSRIIKNVLLQYKAEARGRAYEEFEEELVEGLEDNGYYKIFLKQIFQDVEEYPEHVKEIVKLYFSKGFSAKDISQIVDIKSKTIEQILYRFKLKIKEKYGQGVDR